MSLTQTGRIEGDLSIELRREVLKAIAKLGMSTEELARRLDLIPTALGALLGAENWSLRTALLLADRLELPVKVELVERAG